MTKPNKPTQDMDAALADFADRVLTDKTPASSSDGELRGLEETVLHLSRILPQDLPDEKTRRRMENDFKARVRNISQPAPRLAWRSKQARQRLTLAFATLVLLLVFIAAPLIGSNGNVQGAAGIQGQNIALLIVLVGAIALFLWLGRRK